MPPSDAPTDAAWMETWKEQTSAFDRVKSVTMTLTEPVSAPWIAEEAAVSPNTARDHLRRLIDLGVVTATEDNGTTQYYPDPLYTRLRDIRGLLDTATKQELSEQAAALKADIEAWESEYGVDTPDALREQAAADTVAAEQAYEFTQVASDWDLARYQLSLIRDAITHYDTWTDDQSSLPA